MEHWAHASNNRYTLREMSRLQQDLSGSPHQQSLAIENGDHQPMIRRALPKGRVPHVCIVGAGVAGLRCADTLLQHGVKVTIIEGRDRVGGRLCQSNQLGHLVDLGPNWIHGTDNNPILDLAKETKTVTNKWDGRQSVFDHLGRSLSEKDSAQFTELVWKVIEEAMEHSNAHTATIPAGKSLMDFFEEKAKEMFPTLYNTDEKARSKRDNLLSMAEMWGAFVGSPIQKQSLRFFWLEECIDGENLFVAETYHKILARIAAPALEKADIKFGHKVTRITSKGDEGTLKVDVGLTDRDPVSFDEVVMTTPLGWLKRNQDAFVPSLPPRLIQGIESIGYGTLDKVYIKFPSAFWNRPVQESCNGVAIPVVRHQSTSNVTATTTPPHRFTSPDPEIASNYHHPGFTHWTSPHYAPDTNPHKWNQECVNLAALPSNMAHPTLLFYTFGPTSKHIASLLCHAESPAAAQAALLKFFEPYYSRLPHYSASLAECKPAAALATGWANDELAGYGSYCNFQVGLERGDEDIEIMRKGMPERGVWFAGEHTAPFVALGTVTGAYWAGEGVARRIVTAYGLGAGKNGEKAENGSAPRWCMRDEGKLLP